MQKSNSVIPSHFLYLPKLHLSFNKKKGYGLVHYKVAADVPLRLWLMLKVCHHTGTRYTTHRHQKIQTMISDLPCFDTVELRQLTRSQINLSLYPQCMSEDRGSKFLLNIGDHL